VTARLKVRGQRASLTLQHVTRLSAAAVDSAACYVRDDSGQSHYDNNTYGKGNKVHEAYGSATAEIARDT